MTTNLRFFTTLTIALTAQLLPLSLHAQYTWVGKSPLTAYFDNGENWEDSNGNPSAPTTGGYVSLYFGLADRYDPEVNGSDYRVSYLEITGDAGAAYVITGGDALRIVSGPVGSSPSPRIVNNSSYLLTIEAPLEFIRFGTSAGGNATATFDTRKGDILWSGGSFYEGSGTLSIVKYGFGTLQMEGTHTAPFSIALNEGELLIDTTKTLVHSGTIVMRGSTLRFVGDANADSDQAYLYNHTIQYVGTELTHRRINRVVVDPLNAEYGLTVTMAAFVGAAVERAGGYHFDLSKPGAKLSYLADLASFSALNRVLSWATVTDSSGLTGFAQVSTLTSDETYDIVRYTGYTLLGASVNNAGTGWSNSTHYYVNGNHTLTGTGEYRGLVGQANTNSRLSGTLTIKGSGTLLLNNYHLRASYVLLEEGTGDYTISGLGLASRAGNFSSTEMRLYQYRTDGRLIIDTEYLGYITDMPTSGTPTAAQGATNPADIAADITGSRLFKAGPGTVVLKSPNSNIIGTASIQEGRLQLESAALSSIAAIEVLDGTLGGSGQIGGGTKWIRSGGANVADGTRYTTVTITHGGTIDVTPSNDNIDNQLGALTIYGTLTMEEGSTLTMSIDGDVIAGNYNPLVVYAEDLESEDPTVVLTGSLILDLQSAITSQFLITLLTTTGTIEGTFSSINGHSFGPDNHLILSYNGVDYDTYLYYNYDFGGGVTGVVLHAIPEPSTIALLAGLALVACVGRHRMKRTRS
jgi:hypothetical protein